MLYSLSFFLVPCMIYVNVYVMTEVVLYLPGSMHFVPWLVVVYPHDTSSTLVPSKRPLMPQTRREALHYWRKLLNEDARRLVAPSRDIAY